MSTLRPESLNPLFFLCPSCLRHPLLFLLLLGFSLISFTDGQFFSFTKRNGFSPALETFPYGADFFLLLSVSVLLPSLAFAWILTPFAWFVFLL